MKILSTILFVITLLIGVGFFVYPDVASWWNGRIQSGIIDMYHVDVAQMEQDRINDEIQRAMDFNESINEINISDPFAEIDTLPEEYMRTLNVGGVMATIEIPVVNISMPVLHGTSSAVLDRAAGHLAGTSFPVGGENTHAVITAHSGLPEARMFTDILDGQVTYGDYFFLNVLDQRLAYQVIQIDIVEPHEVELIRLYPGEDFVTLITCTPLAINSHRLLIRGTRVPYLQNMAAEIEPILTMLDTNWRLITAFIGFLAFLLFFVLYQIARILRGWLRKRSGLLPDGEVAPVNPLDNDPYIDLPASAKSNPVYLSTQYGRPRRRVSIGRRQSDGIRRKLAMGMAIVFLLIGATVVLYPQVMRFMYDRYADNLILEWQQSLDDSRNFIQQRWISERANLWYTVSHLPVGSTNGDIIFDGDGNVTIGNLSFEYTSQLTVDNNGYLTLGGLPLSSNGYLTVGDLTIASNGGLYSGEEAGLFVSPDGNLYVSAGGGLYLGTNGGNISLGNLSLGQSGNLYVGNTYIGNITTGNWCYESYDLDFIFNFDLNQDPFYWLNNQMTNHNNNLYETAQEDLNSLEAAEEVYFSVTQVAGITDEMLGFITIEKIDIRIPIFAGSNDGNMLRGAAHMTHTSLPVGGPSTNAVITAHRGLTRARMFRDLHLLENGDIILITNPYQTLTYKVIGYEIVADRLDFDAMDSILIREGVDMITLLTCHPYRVNDQRKLVFAVRVQE